MTVERQLEESVVHVAIGFEAGKGWNDKPLSVNWLLQTLLGSAQELATILGSGMIIYIC